MEIDKVQKNERAHVSEFENDEDNVRAKKITKIIDDFFRLESPFTIKFDLKLLANVFSYTCDFFDSKAILPIIEIFTTPNNRDDYKKFERKMRDRRNENHFLNQLYLSYENLRFEINQQFHLL